MATIFAIDSLFTAIKIIKKMNFIFLYATSGVIHFFLEIHLFV